MDSSKSIPFPQADDFQKILNIININNPEDLEKVETMQIILGDITPRQVKYYLDATAYLDVIDKQEFTEYGLNLRKMNQYAQKISLSQKIVSKEVFGEVYFSEKVLNVKYSKEDVIEVMKRNLSFESTAVYVRRAQTVLKWIEWINSNN